ncbi:hypothetical protein QE416_000660 [Microbacterium sp. SORGH_AS 421]|nr:hypothetical protein [Microbacterium sp. SORGH_AS_0421]
MGSIAAFSSSPTVPPVVLSDANSSLGVVRKSIHHQGRGIALTMVPTVSCGGIEKPLRLSRRRAPAMGVSTVNCRVSKPAAAGSLDEAVRDAAVFHDVELEPVAADGVGRLDVLDRGRPQGRERERDAGGGRRGGSRRLALGLHQTREAGGRDTERERGGPAEDLARGVDVGRGAEDVGVELHVLEGAARAVERQLTLGRTVGVVESGLGGATLGDRAQVRDRQRRVETALSRVELGLLELHELEELADLRQLTLNHGGSLFRVV